MTWKKKIFKKKKEEFLSCSTHKGNRTLFFVNCLYLADAWDHLLRWPPAVLTGLRLGLGWLRRVRVRVRVRVGIR